jgi:dynein heavy chain
MSVLARHRYLISKLGEAFNFDDEQEVENMLLDSEVIKAVDFFFSLDGPSKILFSLENSSTNVLDKTTVDKKKKQFKVEFEEFKNFTDTIVYFMKAKDGRVDPTKINDGALSFGIIRAPLESLEVVLRCVYRPLINDMGDNLWGEASSDQKQEFLLSLDTFANGLQDNIRSLSRGLELRKPDERVEQHGNALVGNAAVVTHSMNILQEWCNNIALYLDDNDRGKWENSDSGPDTELNYWRSRMQRYVVNVTNK